MFEKIKELINSLEEKETPSYKEQVAIRKKLQEIKNEAQQCGEKFPIHRPPCKLRKRKHPKHIWCTRCLKVTKHLKI